MEYADFDYEAYEEECRKIQEENEVHLQEFEQALVSQGLSDKTIRNHISNVDFYINTYLLREDAYRIDEGCHRLDDFLGYFFIRKCMWSTPSSIKQNIASFKKFYKCMVDLGHLNRADYDVMLKTIKENKQEWLDECERFNTPDDEFAPPIDQVLFGRIYDAVARELGLAEMLGINDVDGGEPLSREDALKAFALALLYFSAEEKSSSSADDEPSYVSSTSIGKRVLDALLADGFIAEAEGGLVKFTRSGLIQAEEWISAFGFDYLL